MKSGAPVDGAGFPPASSWHVGGGSGGAIARPYQSSAWVAAAVRIIAGKLSCGALQVASDPDMAEPIEATELDAFQVAPFSYGSRRMKLGEGLNAAATWLLLSGEAFLLLDEQWFERRSRPADLVLRFAEPSLMRAITDGGEVIGWHYRDRHNPLTLPAAQVLHIREFNPYDPIRGLARWKAAQLAAETDHSAASFAKALTDNNGARGSIISADGQISPEQAKQIVASLRRQREDQVRGRFSPVVLSNKVSVAEPTMAAVDSDYLAQRMSSRHEVFIAFGVPPSFADIQASYSIGSASDSFRLLEDTVAPLAALITDGLEPALSLIARRPVFAALNYDESSTMMEVRAERIKSATELWKTGWPWEVLNDRFKLGLSPFSGWDKSFLPMNLVEQGGAIAAPDTPPAPVEPTPADLVQAAFAAKSQKGEPGSPSPGSCLCSADPQKGEPGSPSQKTDGGDTQEDRRAAALYASLRAKRSPWERKIESAVSRVLFQSRATVLGNVAERYQPVPAMSAAEKSIAAKVNALDLIFDLGGFLADLIRAIIGLEREIYRTASIEVWEDELDRDDPMTQPPAEVDLAIATRENYMRNTAEAVFDDVRGVIEEGIEQGDTIDEISARIRGKYNEINAVRARTIAITETTAIYEAARFQRFREAGIEKHRWLSGRDGRVRPTHTEADGQIRPLGEKFQVGQASLLHPGDPQGGAPEVINCRCLTVAVFD